MNVLANDYADVLIPLELHLWDDYGVPWAGTRGDYYSVNGIPYVFFDGVTARRGAYEDIQQQYTYYQSAIQSRANVPTDVGIDLKAIRTGAETYDVTATVRIEAGGTGKTMRLYMVEALDHYPMSSSYARNTLRQVVETGADFTLSPGMSFDLTRSVTFDAASWNQFDDIRLIAWVQTPSFSGPAEIYNAAQSSLTAVPEPGAVVLALLGLAGFVLFESSCRHRPHP